jgi:enoyl-CoA hydratase/3-hydroxyacyl-CoA dehydrogenase
LRPDEVQRVTVLGAGVMGHGIAEVIALAGFDVTVYDIKQEFIDSGISKINWSVSKFVEKGTLSKEAGASVLARVKGTTNLSVALSQSQVVIEAAPEDMATKRELFEKVESLSPKDALFASNTSTLPISEIASATKRADRFIGLHFFNPPPLMPLVEIIMGEKTSDETLAFASAFATKLGKEAVICKKDVPGFIVNRILGPLINEAAWMLERKEATKEQVDSVAMYRVGLPMGLLELADYSGIDTIYKASQAVAQRDPTNVILAPPIKDLFDRGKYGRKSGEGFYKYGKERWARPTVPKELADSLDPLQFFAPSINSCAWLLRNEVCSRDDLDKSVKLGLGFPEGILRMADAWGLDRLVSLMEDKEKRYGKYYAPDELLRKMVSEGATGVKSGRGFYDYSQSEKKLEEIVLRRAPPIAWVIINRPHRLNTLTQKTIDELEQVLKELDADGAIRVVVVKGEGDRAFSAGADLSGYDFGSPSKMFDSARKWYNVFTLVEKLSKPVVAAINGYALGGGCELALACDFRLASQNSQIGLTETTLGLIPGAGGTQRLVRIVGLAKAKEMIFFGQRLGADEALRIGLVDKVLSKDEFDAGVSDFAARLAKRAPLALKYAKYALNFASQAPTDIGELFEAGGFGLLMTSQDVSEGVSAFLSKREPEFKGE